MYGAIREYKLQPGKVNEIIGRIRDEFVPLVTKAPGFVSYTLVHVGGDNILTTSVFENQAEAEESVKIAAGYVKDKMAGFVTGPPRVTTGKFTVRHVKDDAKAGYGFMRRFESKREKAEEISKRVREGLVPELSGMPGFASYGLLVESGQDRGAALMTFADRATAEAANQRALTWVKENIGDMLTKPLEVIAG